jgi:hypothetical protein
LLGVTVENKRRTEQKLASFKEQLKEVEQTSLFGNPGFASGY